MLTEFSHLKEHFRIFTGIDPVLHKLPLFVIAQDKYNVEHFTSHSAIPPSRLQKTRRELYDTAISFKLNMNDFLVLANVIERSITNSKGGHYRKLQEKTNRFGNSNPKTTYLRLTVRDRQGNISDHNYVIEN